MPRDIFMTWYKLGLVSVGICGVIWLLALSLLADIRIEVREQAEKIVTPSDGDASIRNPVRPQDKPVPDGSFRHTHWFVQISDLHVSRFRDHARAPDLKRLCDDLASYIVPEVVLVTGDITDAKHEDLEGSQQFEDEWQSYNKVLHESKILERTVWLDVRGNHDAFNVPSLKSAENYFRVYSVQGKVSSFSYHYLHNTTDGDVISFIAVDACPSPGPKRPFNLFGTLLQAEVSRVMKFVDASSHADQIIFFGHYPSSTINGIPVADIRKLFGHGSVYLCGHLHTLAGMVRHMYTKQKTGYLELELADWKDSRVYRLLAVDHGLVSFVDVPLNSWPVVLITNPKNALFLTEGHEPTSFIRNSTHVRILVFSNASIAAVTVKLDGRDQGPAKHVEGPLFVLPWDPLKFPNGLHTIEVHAKDAAGKEITVSQSFSVDGTQPYFDLLQRFILMSDHVTILKIAFAVTYMATILPLLLFKLFRLHLHVRAQSVVGSCFVRFIQCWVRRLCVLCSKPSIFYPLLGYNIYILVGPWFIGEILDGRFGACFLFGFVLKDVFLPLTLTYLYGFFQLLMFSIPLTLYLARCLDLCVISRHRDNSGQWRLLVCLRDHGIFFLIIGVQVYLVLTGFYRAYGLLALLACPFRTWAVVLAAYLRYQALRHSNHTVNEEAASATVPLKHSDATST